MAVIIGPNTIINSDTQYTNTDIDMSNGNFIVVNNAKLFISNCNINGVLSENIPTLIEVQLGELKLMSNIINLSAPSIMPHPMTQSLQYFIRLTSGFIDMLSNKCSVDEYFKIGLFITDISYATNNLSFINNDFNKFHGVLYLLNSNNNLIQYNKLKLCSYGNIVLIGADNIVNDNEIILAGVDQVGNAIDIYGSQNTEITNNDITISTCRGIFVVSSNHILIDSNVISSGITYGIRVISTTETEVIEKQFNYIEPMIKHEFQDQTHHITISNNVMTQNRFGLSAKDVDYLDVSNNYFSQRFADKVLRKFWTDNSILMKNVTNLSWMNNYYKEAFTQENNGDNSYTKIVDFPVSGGVIL